MRDNDTAVAPQLPESLVRPKGHWLYRAYAPGSDDNDDLLYVGISDDVWARLMQHRVRSVWYSEAIYVIFERYTSRDTLEVAEAHAIRSEIPIYNSRQPRLLNQRLVRPIGSPETWWRSIDGEWFLAFDTSRQGQHRG